MLHTLNRYEFTELNMPLEGAIAQLVQVRSDVWVKSAAVDLKQKLQLRLNEKYF